MTIEFHGADLTVYFHSNPANTAVSFYTVTYQCASAIVVHRVDQADFQTEASDGTRSYQDILTFAENTSAGLTRTPTVSLQTVLADGTVSSADLEYAQNSIPVLAGAPVITPTFDGIQVTLPTPTDKDLVGYVAWIDTVVGVTMDAAHERVRGGSNSFSIPLADDNFYYLRVAPYDAFGLDLNSAWAAITVQRASSASLLQSTTAAVGSLSPQVLAATNAAAQARLDAAAVGTLAANNLAAAQATLSAATATAQAQADQARRDITTEIANRGTSEGNITTSITNLTTTVGQNTTAITSEATSRNNADGALGIRIDNVTTAYQAGDASVAASVTTEAASRSSADGALGTRIDTVTSNYQVADRAIAATVTTNATTSANADSALGTRIDTVTSNYQTADTAIAATVTTEATTRASADSALGTRIDTVTATTGTNATNISNEITARTTADTALGTRIDSTNAVVAGNTANITSNQTALATTNSTVAALSTTISSSYQGAGNVLTNTNFVTTDGWTFENFYGANMLSTGINAAGDLWHPIGENCISYVELGSLSNPSYYVHWRSSAFPVVPGQYIQVYAYCASHRSQTEIGLTFLDLNGQNPTYYESGYQGGTGPSDANGGQNLNLFRQQGFVSIQVPANASQAIIYLRKTTTTANANPGNSYAWFCRPYVGQAKPGQTQWNPYAQGSATANQTAVNATISNNFTTLTNADTAAATQTVALQATAQQGGCYNTDPTFQVQTVGGFPNYWNNYDAGPTGANYLSKVPGRNGIGNAIRVACPQGQSSYFAQAISPAIPSGTWVVAEADFTLNAGALNASGIYLAGAQGIGFSGERDASGGNMGNGTVGKFYQWRKLTQLAGNMIGLYPMTHWNSLGDISANQADITWYRLAVRPATQIEIDSQNVVSTSLPALTTRVTSAESAIVSNNQAIATRTTTLEASTLQSTTYLNRNANFSNWPGASNSPPALSDGAGLDYMARVPGIVGTYGLNYAVPANYGRDFFMAFDGRADPATFSLAAGYYFLECDITLNSGTLASSGCYCALYGSIQPIANSIDFYSSPDVNGNVNGDGVPGTRYKYSYMFDYRAAGNNGYARIHPMPVWSGFGRGNNNAKNITFNQIGIRAPSQQELAGISRDARLTTNEGAITGLNGKTTAYWQTTALAGNNRAQLTIHADANGGAGVDIVGDVSISGTAVIGKSGGGGNMVQNPSSMDGTVKGWQQYEGDGQGYLTSNQGFYSVGRTGFNFGKNNGTGGGTSYVTPAMPVTPGKTYVVSATLGASASCSTGLYFRVIYSQARPASGYIGNRDGYTDLIANGPNGNGGKYEYVWTCPSGMNFAAIAIYNWTNHAQTLYFGDVIFIEQSSSVQIQDGAITASKLTIGSPTGARTAIQTNLITVYDNNNTLRVRLGVF